MISTQINQGNYTAYQPYMLLNFDYSFQNDVLDDDLSVTILEVLGRINLNKFIDFHNLDSRSYDPVMMLTIILMAFAEDGYVFTILEVSSSRILLLKVERQDAHADSNYP